MSHKIGLRREEWKFRSMRCRSRISHNLLHEEKYRGSGFQHSNQYCKSVLMCKCNNNFPYRFRLCNGSTLCLFAVFLSGLVSPSDSFALLDRQISYSAIRRSVALSETYSSFSAPSLLKFRVKSRSRRKRVTELQAIPALAAFDLFFQTSPYAAGAITCGIKASTADFVAQKKGSSNSENSSTKPKKENIKRNIAFTIYGALYQGMAQEYIYNELYPSIFGAGTNPSVVLAKVSFNLFVQSPFLTLPIAFLSKAFVYKHSPKESMRRYWHAIKHEGLLKKYCLLWGPVLSITFSVIPEHFRVAFIACISFFWMIKLSQVASRGVKGQSYIEAKQETRTDEYRNRLEQIVKLSSKSREDEWKYVVPQKT